MTNQSEIKVKSLQKALEILNCFEEKQPLGVTEISEKLGLYKSNVHNILMTFKGMGYLDQDAETGKFRLGIATFTLSRAFREGMNLTKVTIPFMKDIAEEAGELVYLSVPRGEDVVYLEAVYPEAQKLMGKSVAGDCCKMYCTSVGKAILSQMPEEEIEKRIPETLEAFTEYTITDRKLLLEEIRKTKVRGYGIDNMELMFGVKCIGVPILNHEGQIEGGLSISAPSLRMSEERISVFAEILQRYVNQIRKML